MRFSSITFKNTVNKTKKIMSIFVQKINPMTGINDWVVQNEDYDYHQEVARSSFADMLHDTERNKLYEMAIKRAISLIHSQGKHANVLDIGTGTGLLSMMAVRHGADSVIACEGFKPMSECAVKIIKRNGFQDRIKVIPKRSTDLIVGVDLPHKFNILVTEVFDTELIGEGALSTFKHAHETLLEKDSIVVPQSATIYAQVVESPQLQNFNKLKDIFNDEGELLIKIPDKIKMCPGSASVHDLQLNQIDLTMVKNLISPIPVFRFDWSGRTPFIFNRSTINTVKSETTGSAQMVFMWWELQMIDNIVLSCAPYWAHPHKKDLPWRDHWMQAIYYLPKEMKVEKGQEIHLISCHDEYSLWFNIRKDLRVADVDYLNPVCECGLHVCFSRTRIGQMNDTSRTKKYLNLIENFPKNSTILVLSDGFYLGLVAAKEAKKIYILDTNFLSQKILMEFIKFNNILNIEIVKDAESLKHLNEIDILLGEPYFTTSILPWDNLFFIYLLKELKHLLCAKAEIFPKKALIKAVAVKFDNLHKIRTPLGTCEGFLMEDFDNLIKASSNISDDFVEAQPLWEYPAIALSEVMELTTIDFINLPSKVIEKTGNFIIEKGIGGCNGVALWVDWVHQEVPKQIKITTGPTTPPKIGERITWDMYTRQGVCLFPNKEVDKINFNFIFDFDGGNFSFKCS